MNELRDAIKKAQASPQSLLKGDEPGHPFRGNQYTAGEGGAGEASQYLDGGKAMRSAKAASEKATEASKKAKEAGESLPEGATRAEYKALAAVHYEASDAHNDAALAHDDAYNRVAAGVPTGANSPIRQHHLDVADRHKAEDEKFYEAGDRIIASMKAAIKSGKIGKAKKADETEDLSKGDLPGHPFRGNQYQGGGGPGAIQGASYGLSSPVEEKTASTTYRTSFREFQGPTRADEANAVALSLSRDLENKQYRGTNTAVGRTYDDPRTGHRVSITSLNLNMGKHGLRIRESWATSRFAGPPAQSIKTPFPAEKGREYKNEEDKY